MNDTERVVNHLRIRFASARGQTEADLRHRLSDGLLQADYPDPATSGAHPAPPPAPTAEDLPRAGMHAWANYEADDTAAYVIIHPCTNTLPELPELREVCKSCRSSDSTRLEVLDVADEAARMLKDESRGVVLSLSYGPQIPR
eukprot:jgi/Tetstr1/458880/TSEL_004388.t1